VPYVYSYSLFMDHELLAISGLVKEKSLMLVVIVYCQKRNSCALLRD
jgi:hypothetical protein